MRETTPHTNEQHHEMTRKLGRPLIIQHLIYGVCSRGIVTFAHDCTYRSQFQNMTGQGGWSGTFTISLSPLTQFIRHSGAHLDTVSVQREVIYHLSLRVRRSPDVNAQDGGVRGLQLLSISATPTNACGCATTRSKNEYIHE